MPFTTSHPAIILPLKKFFPGLFSLTGLIAGAMSPDLLYFLELTTVNRGVSHSWHGLLWVCLPIGLLFSIVFHYLFKEEFIRNLPSPLTNHLSGLAVTKWRIRTVKQLIVLIISIGIGAISHFFWDSFTHINGVMVNYFPALKTHILIFGKQVPWYRVLQHLSTLFGALAVIIFFSYKSNLPHRLKMDNLPNLSGKIIFWFSTGLFSFLFAFVVLHVYKLYEPELITSDMTVFGLAGWSGFFYAVCGISMYKIIKEKIIVSNKSAPAEY